MHNFELDLKDVNFREGTGISNLDGRLWGEVGREVARFFSDEAMVRARVAIEARYLVALSKKKVIRKLTKKETAFLLSLHQLITPAAYKKLRKIESEARHDVITMTKVMKTLAKRLNSLADILNSGWIHWGLSSEDVDNLSKMVLIRNFLDQVYLSNLKRLISNISLVAGRTSGITIPGKTHLQTAIPTVLGKEIALFAFRLAQNFSKIKHLKLTGKFAGAVGNLSAHKSAYPTVNWLEFSKSFVESLGLESNPYVTQIDTKERFVEFLQIVQNVNSILIDFSQDMRLYIGFDWLAQQTRNKEFGSSAMPQKVNPIDFENSQGNALLSNWILEGLIRQLPISWLQRDLVDKTIQRNLGLPFGYSTISVVSANKGISRVSANTQKIKSDLESDWGSLAEAFQVNLRARGMGDAYDKLKKATRGKKLKKEDIKTWIKNLKVNPKSKQLLNKIDHEFYIGYAIENCQNMLKMIKRLLD